LPQDLVLPEQRVSNSSSYRGVSFHKHAAKWQAMIKVQTGRCVSLGSYATELEAAKAYDTAAVFFRGR
jgi:hypothetical protein